MKYRSEIAVGTVFFISCALISGTLLYFSLGRDLEAKAVLPAIAMTGLALCLTAFAFSLLYRSIRNHQRVSRDLAPDLVLDDRGISGTLSLLEGGGHRTLDGFDVGRFSVRWEDIESVSLTSTQSNAVRGASAPPYYVIARIGKPEPVYLLRRPLAGHEDDILSALTRRLPQRVQVDE